MASEIQESEMRQHQQNINIEDDYDDDDDDIEQHLVARINHAIDHLGDKQLPAQNEIKSDFEVLLKALKSKKPPKEEEKSSQVPTTPKETEQKSSQVPTTPKETEQKSSQVPTTPKETEEKPSQVPTTPKETEEKPSQVPTKEELEERWLSFRRENLYYLNNLLCDWLITKNKSSFSPKTLVQNSTDNIKKSLKKMKKDLKVDPTEPDSDDLDKSVSHHQPPDHPIYPRNKEEVYRWSSRHKPRNVYGFEHMVMAMERELVLHDLNAPFKVFGVEGVAGIGKTTLCQDIFNRDRVKKNFCPRIWVCLSKQPNARKNYNEEIVVRILKCLGMEDEIIGVEHENDPNSLKRLILLLRLQLVGKRFLLVLDDAWKDDPFFSNLHQKEQLPDNWGAELAYGLPKGCGGTIISSSRSADLLKKMLGHNVSLQHIKPHTKENIGKIFDEAVKGYDEDVREFGDHLKDQNMYNAIIKKCDGIPLAAKLLAKIARDNLSPPKAKTEPPAATGAGRHEIKPARGVDAGSRPR